MRKELKSFHSLYLIYVVMILVLVGCTTTAPKATAVVTYESVGKQITYAVTQWQGLRDQKAVTPEQDVQFKTIYKKVYDTYQMAGKIQKQIIVAKTEIEKNGFQATYEKLLDQVLANVTDILMLASKIQEGGK